MWAFAAFFLIRSVALWICAFVVCCCFLLNPHFVAVDFSLAQIWLVAGYSAVVTIV
jgi:NADH:ubiquinone oxidoreductase subunit B-like Fe-S oxidoreductase